MISSLWHFSEKQGMALSSWLSAYRNGLAVRRRGVGNAEALGRAFVLWVEAEILNPELFP